MKLLKSGVLLYLGCLCALNAPAQGNIVQNGAFDSPNGMGFPGWTCPGYVFVPGYPDSLGPDGGSFVGVSQYISQDLTTLPGQTYVLQFSIRDTIPGITVSGPNAIGVHWGSQDLGIFPLVPLSSHWDTHQLFVTAVENQTTLSFTQVYGAWPYLDAVSVVAVPEPGIVTLWLMGIALLPIKRLRNVFNKTSVK